MLYLQNTFNTEYSLNNNFLYLCVSYMQAEEVMLLPQS